MSRFAVFSYAVILLVGCVQPSHPISPPAVSTAPSAPESVQQAASEADGELTVGEPIVFRNLAVFPVLSTTPRDEDRYLTLDEGLKTGLVEIFEMGAAGEAASHGTDAARQTSPAATQEAMPSENPFSAPPTAATDDLFSQSETAGPETPDNNKAAAENQQVANSVLAGSSGGSRRGPANEVNRVLVLNKSNRPLYLMPGEILVGGDQDRTIGEELVIQPGKNPVTVDVFCVEQGRWGSRGAEGAELLTHANGLAGNLSLAVSQSQTLQQTAEAANNGKFVASAGALNKPARLAVQDAKDQSAVWGKVAESNRAANVQSDTDTFTEQYLEKDSLQRLEPYVGALYSPIHDLPRVVGVVVAVNGDVETLDVFESTPLFRKLWPKLLKSYALDAAQAQDDIDPDSKIALCSVEDARRFLTEAVESRVEETEEKQGIAMTKRASDSMVSYSAAASAGGGGFGGGGFGGSGSGSLHTSGYSK